MAATVTLHLNRTHRGKLTIQPITVLNSAHPSDAFVFCAACVSCVLATCSLSTLSHCVASRIYSRALKPHGSCVVACWPNAPGRYGCERSSSGPQSAGLLACMRSACTTSDSVRHFCMQGTSRHTHPISLAAFFTLPKVNDKATMSENAN